MTEQCQPNTTEAHLWNRIRACQYANEAAAARIHDLEVALRKIAKDPPANLDEPDIDWQFVEKMRVIARDALGARGLARTP